METNTQPIAVAVVEGKACPLTDEFWKLLQANLKIYGSNKDYVDLILIADEESYGGCIKAIDETEGHTNTEHFVGFGKTIPRSKEKSTIIIRREIMEVFAIFGKTGFHDFPSEQQYFAHVLFHEMGHAEDNARRGLFGISKVEATEYKIDEFSKVFLPVLEDEFSACLNCSHLITDSCFEIIVKTFDENRVKLEEQIRESKLTGAITEIYRTVVSGIWRIFVEFSKVCGYKSIRASASIQEGEFTSFSLIEKILDDQRARYPALLLTREVFNPLVAQYALSLGYRIIPTEDSGDGIFW